MTLTGMMGMSLRRLEELSGRDVCFLLWSLVTGGHLCHPLGQSRLEVGAEETRSESQRKHILKVSFECWNP